MKLSSLINQWCFDVDFPNRRINLHLRDDSLTQMLPTFYIIRKLRRFYTFAFKKCFKSKFPFQVEFSTFRGRFVWRRFGAETFCRGDVLYVRQTNSSIRCRNLRSIEWYQKMYVQILFDYPFKRNYNFENL
jgi:hypothetical protein